MSTEVPSHFYTQSAVLPYRLIEGRVEFLLVTSRRKNRWVLPKGVVDPELSAVDSAVKEAWEEAGIEGTVSSRALGSYRYEKWAGVCTVDVFLLRVEEVSETWPESHRKRQWLEPREAALRVDEPGLQQIIVRSAAVLQPREAD